MENLLSYSQLVDEAIKKKKFSLDEIASKTSEYGSPVTYSYLSKLKNGKTPPPSPAVSLVLSKVLEIPIETLLAASQYESIKNDVDKVKGILKQVYPELKDEDLNKKCWDLLLNNNDYLLRSNNDEKPLNEENETWYAFVFEKVVAHEDIETLSTGRVGSKLVEVRKRKFITPYVTDFIYFIAPDDTMSQACICKNDFVLVEVQDSFENGDIVLVNIDGADAVIRKIVRLEDGNFWILSTDQNVLPILYNKERCRIVGVAINGMYEI